MQTQTETKQQLLSLAANMGTIMTEIIEAGGELSPKLEAMLEQVGTDPAVKVDSYVMVMDRPEAEEDFLKMKAEAFARVARGCANLRERLKYRIRTAIEFTGEDEVRGNDFRFKLVRGRKRMIVDDKALPEQWLITVTETKADNERIRAALEAGEIVPGAWLEDVVSLRKFVAKKGN